MEDSPLTSKIYPNMSHFIKENAKVFYFFNPQNIIRLTLLSYPTNHIMNKIKAVPIHFSDLKDRIK